jgi:Kef-type K+ transport system membrane component KefB
LFFASVGFIIPIRSLFSPLGMLYGLFYAVAAFIGKIATALCVKPLSDGWVLGTAMVGRGEVGILMAMQSMQSGTISQELFVITIWAVLLNTIVSPYLFGYALNKKLALETTKANEENLSEFVTLEE